jgi:hypothetical protein
MIDTIVNLFMIVGIVVVSVPVLFFGAVGAVHLAYGAYKLATHG